MRRSNPGISCANWEYPKLDPSQTLSKLAIQVFFELSALQKHHRIITGFMHLGRFNFRIDKHQKKMPSFSSLTAFVVLFCLACALHVDPTHEQTTFPTDINALLTLCTRCGPSDLQESATIYETNPVTTRVIWTVENYGDKIALKGFTGKYLARCSGCWKGATNSDGVFVHATNPAGSPWALWTPVSLGNYKWALRGDNGKYLARCNGCVRNSGYSDFAFCHADTYVNAPWAQWEIKRSFFQ